jgi:Bacterial Ig domain
VRDSELLRSGRIRPLLGSRGAGLAITGICGALCLVAAACSSSAPSASSSGQHGSHAGTTTHADTVAQVSITPASGSAHVNPEKGVTVRVAHGKLGTVKIAGDPGTLSQNGTVWHSLWPLHPGRHYTVTATAQGINGKAVTATSSFRTVQAAQTFQASTILGNETYGVGIPIMIDFNHAVLPRYRANIERAIQIKSSKPVVGAWEWDSRCSNAVTCLNFRTRQYWPQYTKVSFDAHFNGVQVAPGVFGTSNLSQRFRIGYSLIGLTSTGPTRRASISTITSTRRGRTAAVCRATTPPTGPT